MPVSTLYVTAMASNPSSSVSITDVQARRPSVQLSLSKAAFIGPVNARVALPAELRGLVPAGRDDAEKMIRLDWAHLAKHRAAWLERWNREIAP